MEENHGYIKNNTGRTQLRRLSRSPVHAGTSVECWQTNFTVASRDLESSVNPLGNLKQKSLVAEKQDHDWPHLKDIQHEHLTFENVLNSSDWLGPRELVPQEHNKTGIEVKAGLETVHQIHFLAIEPFGEVFLSLLWVAIRLKNDEYIPDLRENCIEGKG